jgi:RNA polymerase sigma-70 factor (ECF subfamily)
MLHETTLTDLLVAVAKGDRNALRAIYARQSTRLFGIAMAILRDRNAAADVLQDSFLKLWQRADQFDPARNPQAWIDAIVRYGALDVARARGRETLTDDPTLGDGPVEFDVVDAIGRAEENARLRGCLEKLDERTRHSIALAFVRGMSHAEVAHEMNMPLGTVKSIIRRGLLNLRGCLS